VSLLLLLKLRCTRFADRDMFVCFTGGGIGHQNTALATRTLREGLLKLFGLNFTNDPSNDHDINDPIDGDNAEDGSDVPEDEEWEDIQSDIDASDLDDVESSDFEDDGGECGPDEEDDLGFGSF
jgi:hypothetical protein